MLAVVVFHVFIVSGALEPPRDRRRRRRARRARADPVLRDLGLPALPTVGRGARRGGATPPRPLRYARRRALRILPAYWVALTVLAIFPGITGVVHRRLVALLLLPPALRRRDARSRDPGRVDALRRGGVLPRAAALGAGDARDWRGRGRSRSRWRCSRCGAGAAGADRGGAPGDVATLLGPEPARAEHRGSRSAWRSRSRAWPRAPSGAGARRARRSTGPGCAGRGGGVRVARWWSCAASRAGCSGSSRRCRRSSPYARTLAEHRADGGADRALLLAPAISAAAAACPARAGAAPLAGLGLVSYGVYLWHLTIAELIALPADAAALRGARARPRRSHPAGRDAGPARARRWRRAARSPRPATAGWSCRSCGARSA